MTTHRLKMPFKPLLMIILALFALTVQGCFHRSDNDSDNGPTNAAPVFTSGTAISVGDGSTATGYTATATDADGDTVTFSLSGGTDQRAFSIDSDSGELSFNNAPVFNNPGDSDGDNVYVVDITAIDGTASVVQTVTVTVIDDANPMGYYINTGSASVAGSGGDAINISDLQAIVRGNRIMMMSVANKLLYDGMITNITGNDFTADFVIYTGGENPITAVVSGTITEGSSITGTLTGTGVGSGTFSLLYAMTNSEVADISRIKNGDVVGGFPGTWEAVIGNGTAAFEFIVEATGVVVDDVSDVQGLFHRCEIGPGSISPIVDTNLYEISARFHSCENSSVNNTAYTGFATTRSQLNTDDTLVFMVTSGAHSFSSDFK